MTPKLATYIRLARHHIEGSPLDEEDQIDQQRTSAIQDFQVYLARRMDILVRMEVFLSANWFWDVTGPAVRFLIDDQSFLLAQQNESCQLFLEADGIRVPLAVLSDEDTQFEDHFLVKIGDVLGSTSSHELGK